MEPWNEEEYKDVIKEALHEWLDEKYAEFGKWTLHGLLAAVIAGLIGFVMYTQGLK